MLDNFPCFFAPEILLDGSYDGRAADVWSLGCVMLEMLLGHAAFSQVWCPPYDQLKNDDKFRSAIHVAVQEVKADKIKNEFEHSEFGEIEIKDIPRVKKLSSKYLTNSWTTILLQSNFNFTK